MTIFLTDPSKFDPVSPPSFGLFSDGIYSIIVRVHYPKYDDHPGHPLRPALIVSPLIPFISQAPSIITLIAAAFEPIPLHLTPRGIYTPNSPHLPDVRRRRAFAPDLIPEDEESGAAPEDGDDDSDYQPASDGETQGSSLEEHSADTSFSFEESDAVGLERWKVCPAYILLSLASFLKPIQCCSLIHV
jgi:hypothetical protein